MLIVNEFDFVIGIAFDKDLYYNVLFRSFEAIFNDRVIFNSRMFVYNLN